MKKTAFALALLVSGAAFAQAADTAATTAYEGDGAVTAAYETEGTLGDAYRDPTLAGADTAATAIALVEPGNANPERDARGIAVISAAAVAPAGWNGVPASAAMGGPELDSVTGETVAPDSYPACTATVTDKCLQTYERGRR